MLSNKEVQKFLQDRAITAWESVGPVPQVTIDFGNGKTIRRTLGGNTILQVLLPNGRVIDALPGVYTPEAFLSEVKQAFALVDTLGGANDTQKKEAEIIAWHRERANASLEAPAGYASLSKSFVESPLLRRAISDIPGVSLMREATPQLQLEVRGLPLPVSPVVRVQRMDAAWYQLAYQNAAGRIRDLSKEPLSGMEVQRLSQQGLTSLAASVPVINQTANTPEERGRLAVVMDSINNLLRVHPIVHLYLAGQEKGLPEARACREELYQKVLHLPTNDPYLGLADALVPGSPGPEQTPSRQQQAVR